MFIVLCLGDFITRRDTDSARPMSGTHYYSQRKYWSIEETTGMIKLSCTSNSNKWWYQNIYSNLLKLLIFWLSKKISKPRIWGSLFTNGFVEDKVKAESAFKR